MKKHLPFLAATAMLAVMVSCSSHQHTAHHNTVPQKSRYQREQVVNPSRVNAVSELSPTQTNLTLMDYLRRVPGIQVSGNMVMIRGINSITQSVEPLYIIDNTPVGNSYTQAAGAVDVNDIKTVSVLKDAASTSLYGVRGGNGVILITTKRSN